MLASRRDGSLDLHAPAVLSDMSVPVAFTSAMPELAQHLKETVNPDFILSPDKGAIDRASSVTSVSIVTLPRKDPHRRPHHRSPSQGPRRRWKVCRYRGRHDRHAPSAERPKHFAVKEPFRCTLRAVMGSSPAALSHAFSVMWTVHATGSLPNARDVISGGPALARGVEQVLGELGLSS